VPVHKFNFLENFCRKESETAHAFALVPKESGRISAPITWIVKAITETYYLMQKSNLNFVIS